MKKQLFSFVMMLALVLVAGTVMAQTSLAPWEGMKFTYTVTALHAGDVVTVSLTPSTSVDPSTGAITVASTEGSDVWYTPTLTFAALSTDGNKAFEVTWGSSAYVSGTSYKLWITVTNGCSNYRYVTITPVENTFNLSIAAIGSGDGSNTGLTLASSNAPASECLTTSQLVNENYDATSAGDGSTYVYFRVKRTSPLDTYTWKYDVAFTGISGATQTQFSYDGSDWTTTAFSASAQNIPATDNEVYIRILMPASSTSRDISATISQQTLGSFDIAYVKDITATDDKEASYIINPIPSIGGFSGN